MSGTTRSTIQLQPHFCLWFRIHHPTTSSNIVLATQNEWFSRLTLDQFDFWLPRLRKETFWITERDRAITSWYFPRWFHDLNASSRDAFWTKTVLLFPKISEIALKTTIKPESRVINCYSNHFVCLPQTRWYSWRVCSTVWQENTPYWQKDELSCIDCWW